MRLNIVHGDTPPHAGYVNARTADFSPAKLDFLVDDAEAEEIRALDVLDYLPRDEVEPTLDHWVKKLGRGGRLIVGGLDLADAARRVVDASLGHAAAIDLIYGEQRAPWQARKLALTTPVLLGMLAARGLEARSVRYNQSFYTIEARRP